MLKILLIDRFKLELHRATKEFSVYVLVAGKDGPKVSPVPEGNERSVKSGTAAVSFDSLAQLLSRWMDRPVIDQTALTGEYAIPIEPIVREEMLALKDRGRAATVATAPDAPAEAAGSGIFGVIQSFGLKLEGRRMTLPLLVIDRLEKQPTQN